MSKDRQMEGVPEDAEGRGKAGKGHHHPHGPFTVLVGGEGQGYTSITIEQPTPTGRQILTEAGFTPAEDHALIQLLRPGSHLVGIDDQVDLREAEENVFRAFSGGEVFLFTVDGHGYQWGAPAISEPDLRYVADVPEDKVLVLKRDGEDVVIEAGEEVALSPGGVEHLHTRHGMVTVTLDGDEKHIHAGVYTTEELIQVLGVEPGYLLNVVEDGQLVLLQPGEKVRVKDGMAFISQVPSGGSA